MGCAESVLFRNEPIIVAPRRARFVFAGTTLNGATGVYPPVQPRSGATVTQIALVSSDLPPAAQLFVGGAATPLVPGEPQLPPNIGLHDVTLRVAAAEPGVEFRVEMDVFYIV